MVWLMVKQEELNQTKALRDKAFKIASDPKYDGYQRGLVSMVYKFFDKWSSGSSVAAEPNYQTTKELGIYCVQLICLVNMHGLFL